jgi:YebC/PmpR family DNA-binding regulatory protein
MVMVKSVNQCYIIFRRNNMSGHSKWSTIKRAKGLADVKKSASFSRLANAIIVAAKNGGGNPDSNFTLKMAIDKARVGLMPKDNIERAIKRGTGEIGGAVVEEALYEAIGPDGAGILIEAATDNKNRTTPEIKNILTKAGAKFASTGAVNYHFNKLGKIVVDLNGRDREEAELLAIDAGSEDFTEHGDDLAVFTKPNELWIVKKLLEEKGLSVKDVVLSWEPKDVIIVEDKEQADKLMKLVEALEELDDVTGVFF